MFTIVASANPPVFKRIEDRRRKVEQARTLNVRRMHDDIKLLAKREFEFTKSLLAEAFPIKVEFDETVFDRSPIKITYAPGSDDGDIDAASD